MSLILTIPLGCNAEEPAGEPQSADEPQASPAMQPEQAATQPAMEDDVDIAPDAVVATVGTQTITFGEIESFRKQNFTDAPASYNPIIRRQILHDQIFRALLHQFLEAKEAKMDEEFYKEMQQNLDEAAAEQKLSKEELMNKLGMDEEAIEDQVRARTLVAGLITAEKLQEFVAAHPNYFNGTKVTAKHILIQPEALVPAKRGRYPIVSTEQRQKALDKLADIAKQIREGEMTFEEAAQKYSEGPSKAQGGDLGEFEFFNMVPTFASAAWKLEEGQISAPVISPFGYHLIMVTSRAPGEGEQHEKATDIASGVIQAELESEIYAMTEESIPVEISKEFMDATDLDKLPPIQPRQAAPQPQPQPQPQP
jgi:parvulin-like peptidyl-prolyl isomerase